MTKLYAINHDVKRRLWCGPAAIAAVTGKPTSAVYRANEGRCSMYPLQIVDALQALGFDGSYNRVSDRPTFAQFRKARSAGHRREVWIVFITGHFVVLTGNRFVDNNNLDPILASEYKGQRKRVKGYIQVSA